MRQLTENEMNAVAGGPAIIIEPSLSSTPPADEATTGNIDTELQLDPR